MAHSDEFTLGGQTFIASDLARGAQVSEFETGIKIGKATYDSREHAFFLVFDDFSGGLGHRRLDIRDELGTFWESLKTNAPDLRRSGHMTLPPPSTTTSLTAATAIDLSVTTGDYPWLRLADNSYIFGIGNKIYQTTDGASFNVVATAGADAGGCGSLIQYIDKDATIKYFAFFWSKTAALTGTARYLKSVDGVTWTNGASDKVLHHGIYWDNKIVAVWGRSVIFAVLSSGVEAWNIDDVNDAEFITNVASDHITFIGIVQAPWGEPAVHFHNAVNLFVLDFFARKSYPIDVGVGRFIHDAKLWNGDIAITDGWNCFLYSPSGQTIRNIGLPKKDGISPEMKDANGQANLRFLTPSDAYLYAVVSKPAASGERRSYLFCYNGTGWGQLGGELTNFEPSGIFQANYRTFGLVSARKVHITGAVAYNSTTTKVATYSLPEVHHIPSVGIDTFGPSGAQWVSGWIDGGFNDIDGALLRLTRDAFGMSATSTLKVEYRLDNAETAAWIQMVDTNNVADVFDNSTANLYFSAAVPKRGVQFRTVQFRFTLNRGGTSTDSPEIKALTLVYIKKPEFRSAWTLTIDVNRMVETKTLVDGVAATMLNVWVKLRALWDTKTLLPLIIPNIEPSPGINILITEMPLTFDDFRNAVAGLGKIDISVLEPVPR